MRIQQEWNFPKKETHYPLDLAMQRGEAFLFPTQTPSLGQWPWFQPHSPMEAVHHLQVDTQVLLGEVVQHACIHQALHEVAPVLGEPQARQPLIPNPLMVHVSIGQGLGNKKEESRATKLQLAYLLGRNFNRSSTKGVRRVD